MSAPRGKRRATRWVRLPGVTWMFVSACGGTAPPPKQPPAPSASTTSAQELTQPAAPGQSAAPSPPTGSSAPPLGAAGTPCGALHCLAFASPEDAFLHVVAKQPRILAIGEAHALAGSQVPSVTHRFTHDLLPLLKGKASSLVVELLLPDPKCQKQAKVVRREQQVVTKQQSKANQNEFVELGHAARALGVEPFPLRPSCEQLERVASAGPDTVIEMLGAITELTKQTVQRLLARDASQGRDLMVVPYGGAMHNDLSPAPERAQWSFGPSLSELVGGRYVELDLIVPEFIKDTEPWRSLPWYDAYDPERQGGHAVLLQPGPRSYVLVFPKTVGPTGVPGPAGNPADGGGDGGRDGGRDG